MTSTVPDGAAAQALLVAGLGGSGWVAGCTLGPTSPTASLARRVTTAGAVWCAGSLVEVPTQVTPAAETDETRARYVAWQVRTTGQVVPLLGTPSLSPLLPELDPALAYLGAERLDPTTVQLLNAPALDLRIALRPVSSAIADPPTVIASTPADVDLAGDADSYDITVTRDLVINLTGDPRTGQHLLLLLRQDSVGTWALSDVSSTAGPVLWLGGNPPSLLTGAGARTKIALTWDGGAWLGEWANYL